MGQGIGPRLGKLLFLVCWDLQPDKAIAKHIIKINAGL